MGQRNPGTEFERETSARLGLDLVAGSGNQWHSKLDLKGRFTRWSLKFTSKDRYTLKQSDIDEMVKATQGLTGDGSIPLLLLRLGDRKYDLVIIALEDFLAIQEGEAPILENTTTRSTDRRRRAKTPSLLRKNE